MPVKPRKMMFAKGSRDSKSPCTSDLLRIVNLISRVVFWVHFTAGCMERASSAKSSHGEIFPSVPSLSLWHLECLCSWSHELEAMKQFILMRLRHFVAYSSHARAFRRSWGERLSAPWLHSCLAEQLHSSPEIFMKSNPGKVWMSLALIPWVRSYSQKWN